MTAANADIPVTGVTRDALLAATHELSTRLAQQAAARDAGRTLPFDVFAEIRQLRLGALRVPISAGGAGGSWRDVAQQYLALARGDASVAQAFLGHVVFVERLRLMGTAAQQQQYLPLAAAGYLFSGAAAERGGQFRGELQTRLTAEGDYFRLNGLKHYSTGALFGDWLKIRCLNDQNQLVSAIVPANRPGIIRHDDWNGMGQRCTASGTTELNHVRVAASEVLMMEPWRHQRHHAGATAQIIHCAIDTGIALAALDDALDFARQHVRPVKESGVTKASEDPYLLHTVGEMSAHCRAAEALVLSAADQLEAAASARFTQQTIEACEHLAAQASLAVAEAKTVSTRASLAVSQWLFDIGGASATVRTRNLDRHWRNARTHTTHDPLAYKYRTLGDFYVNGELPPLTFSY
ncbi:acyl-CoA dehydrogenase family protein [Pantoea cypripedii]|uniref:Dehydrogenase n=1 Tax=Pantoea cypripedii TaxID=55209 RepID=A0A6B9G4Z6_PANCY|nr:acyl-CoA dehydrogenase family protein [Pantoea cypripedii]QGY32604.1 dehydrogenase [Pantoea cypripedii]